MLKLINVFNKPIAVFNLSAMKKIQKAIFIALIIFYLPGFDYLTEAQEISKERLKEPTPKKIIPIGNITVLGSYSKVCGGNDISGVYVSGNFAPVVRLSPSDYLIPL